MFWVFFFFLCPSDGDVKSEVPCAGTATTCARKRFLLQSSLRVGSLGPLQRQNLLGNTHVFFWPWHSKLQTLVGILLFRLLIVNIGLGVRVKVNIGWIIDKS